MSFDQSECIIIFSTLPRDVFALEQLYIKSNSKVANTFFFAIHTNCFKLKISPRVGVCTLLNMKEV